MRTRTLVGAIILAILIGSCIYWMQRSLERAAATLSHPTPARSLEPTRIPFYELPTPAPALPTPEASSPTPTPAFTPDPEVLAFANSMLSQRPWLEAKSIDPNVPIGASPATTFLVSRVEPVVARDGDTWKITFKP